MKIVVGLFALRENIHNTLRNLRLCSNLCGWSVGAGAKMLPEPLSQRFRTKLDELGKLGKTLKMNMRARHVKM